MRYLVGSALLAGAILLSLSISQQEPQPAQAHDQPQSKRPKAHCHTKQCHRRVHIRRHQAMSQHRLARHRRWMKAQWCQSAKCKARVQRKRWKGQGNVGLGRIEAARLGWTGEQFACLYALWNRESGWNHRVSNHGGSGAYGIPQALPGAKMSSHGKDWATNPRTQIRWGISYIKARYKTPCAASAFQAKNNWY